ncbi:MAG: hypothetical protein QOH86_74, partial [Sphingomonadales bacterium]|nr:hypothetical protein [Sphingomonadales bacterium]
MSKPVFLDPSGRRGRWTRSSILALLLLVFGAAAVFALTIVEVPLPGPLPLGIDRSPLHALAERIGFAHHKPVRREYYGGTWLPSAPARGAHQERPTVSAFYVPWDETSRASLAEHVDEIDEVMPALATVTGPGHDFRIVADPAFDHIVAGAARPPKVLPMVQNVNDSTWDVAGTVALLHDPAARARLSREVADYLAARGAAGVVFDFEELPEVAQADYKRFLAETRR